MVDQSIFCPNDGVEVKVEVGSNRSFNRFAHSVRWPWQAPEF